MTGLLISIFLGPFGGYRFYKKQYVLGVVYLLTFGIFCIGWFVDIFLAIREMTGLNKEITGTETVMGAFAECKKNPSKKRVEVLQSLSVGSKLTLEIDYYQGKPYYIVVDPISGLDIGSLRAETSATIRKECPDAQMSAVLIKKDIDYPEISLTINK
ncbi:MAG: TM2 domain-containing protein [Aeriscardovia sp.]|nr:TM2 domain-containing protein [Aeriscardovia sp.]